MLVVRSLGSVANARGELEGFEMDEVGEMTEEMACGVRSTAQDKIYRRRRRRDLENLEVLVVVMVEVGVYKILVQGGSGYKFDREGKSLPWSSAGLAWRALVNAQAPSSSGRQTSATRKMEMGMGIWDFMVA